MVSYMKKMIWGAPATQAAAHSAANEELKHNSDDEYDEDENQAAAAGGIHITPDQIVKQGWLFKRSRYLQQWKK